MKNKGLLIILFMALLTLIISSCGTHKPVLVTTITVIGEDEKETVTVGDTLQMIAQIQPDNASNKEVIWSVENDDESSFRNSRAEITKEGVLTGLTVGTVVVKATAEDGSDVEGIKEITVVEPTLYNMPMVLVRAGSFQMGDTKGEGQSDESPVHTVNLTYDYYIGQYEVVSDILHRRYPLVLHTWYNAIHYCNDLSGAEGLHPAYDKYGNLLDTNGQLTTDITQVEGYRLPTEAEWEYAARGGHEDIRDGEEINDFSFAGSNNPNEVAWTYENSHGIYFKKPEVGEKAPNELGLLYDMSGYVWEWCYDRYGEYPSATQTNPIGPEHGYWRVVRGGSMFNPAGNCRVTEREDYPPELKRKYIGFRVARTCR